MRTFFVTVGLLFLTWNTYAQHPLQKDNAQLNAGVGLSSWGIPVYGGFDYGVDRDISVGAEVTYRSYHDDWIGYRYDLSVVGISGNGNYHFNRILKIPDKWDVYAGLNLGFYSWSSPSGYAGNHNSGLGLGVQFGGRYYFSKTVGINLEFGGGNEFSGGKFGVSFLL